MSCRHIFVVYYIEFGVKFVENMSTGNANHFMSIFSAQLTLLYITIRLFSIGIETGQLIGIRR